MNIEDQDERIEAIFPKRIDDISKRIRTFKVFKKFLEKQLSFPVEVTGKQYFKWEDYYIFGPGDKEEYERYKKTRPCYKEIYNLIRIQDYIEEDYGLFAKVTRKSDRKRFEIPLADLTCTDEPSKNHQLIDDYGVWFANY